MQTPRPRCGQPRKCDDMKVGRNCGQTRKCDDTNVGRNKTKGMTQQDESKFKKQGLTTPNLLGKIPYHSTKRTGTERKQRSKNNKKLGLHPLMHTRFSVMIRKCFAPLRHKFVLIPNHSSVCRTIPLITHSSPSQQRNDKMNACGLSS